MQIAKSFVTALHMTSKNNSVMSESAKTHLYNRALFFLKGMICMSPIVKRVSSTTGFTCVAASFFLLLGSGCATKNYVKSQTAPLAQKTNELDDQTAANNRNLQNANDNATQGIATAQKSADTATQNAQQATLAASTAQKTAQDAVYRSDSLASVVANLDNYKQVADASVTFGFNKDSLTRTDKQELDQFAAQLTGAKSYILEVTGGTDSVGSASYNYDLSQRRAQAVVQYIASKYNVPAHKFYLIGIGKDQEVAPNNTAAGRAKNRRVEIQLLSNMPQTGGSTVSQAQPPAQ
jgi:outer membrane protein OmpA-like peptidoglycan-associated protein